MKTPAVSISVTEAARNFSDCVNRVRYQGTTFILHKNGVAVARMVPEPGTPERDAGPKRTGTKRVLAVQKRAQTTSPRAR
jgi:antitoxin (DNA-binding transcriptional repressor) of toxin-antitoxin stability system